MKRNRGLQPSDPKRQNVAPTDYVEENLRYLEARMNAAADDEISLTNPFSELASNPSLDEYEAKRNLVLDSLNVVGTEQQGDMFDNVTAQTARLMRAPICLVSLVTRDKQWFKSRFGLPGATETRREVAICNHSVMPDAPEIFIVPDVLADPRFRTNPLINELNIRFYAARPLIVEGVKVGTLCVIDTHAPRTSINHAELLALKGMGDITVDLLRLHKHKAAEASKAKALFDEKRLLLKAMDFSTRALILVDKETSAHRVVYANAGACKLFGIPHSQLMNKSLYSFLGQASPAMDKVRMAIALTHRDTVTLKSSRMTLFGAAANSAQNDKEFWVRCEISHFNAEEGNQAFLEMAEIDDRQTDESAERLTAKMASKATLLRKFSAEIRVHCDQIIGAAASLTRANPADALPEQAMAVVKHILDNGVYLAGLVTNMNQQFEAS